MAMLEIEGLGFRIDARSILQELDLAIGEREIHALLGANGTGKTTLANLIMGVSGYVPSVGHIRFGGRLIDALPMHERAQLGITLAWQEPARFDGLRVREYLELGSVDAGECLRRVGLAPETYLDRAVDKTLSGGERKRIELASVLGLRPKLAILDEPASGIDLLSIDEIADVIRHFTDDGASVLLITHQQEIARVADRASYLCGGRIIATGTPAAIAERYLARACDVCDGKVCR